MIWRLLVYLAILTLLFGGAGCSSSESSGGNTVVDPPTAAFNATPTIGTAPLLVTFEDKSMGTIDSWFWTFGDGGTSSVQNPIHTYTSAGVYTVVLVVTNTSGSSTFTCSSCITVTDPAQPPTADFNATPTIGTAPLLVTFEDKSMGTIDSWFWTFGDGDTSSLQNPLHTYSDVGVFTVTLTVSGPGGSDMATCSNCINVSAAVTNWDEFNWDQENWEG